MKKSLVVERAALGTLASDSEVTQIIENSSVPPKTKQWAIDLWHESTGLRNLGPFITAYLSQIFPEKE